MPRRLTLAQRMVEWDGRPTAAAKVATGLLAATAAAAGYAAGPGGGDRPAASGSPVPESRLVGGLPAPAETAHPGSARPWRCPT